MKEFKSAHSKMFSKRRGGGHQQQQHVAESPLQKEAGESAPSRSGSPIAGRQFIDNTRQQPQQARRSNATATANGVAKAIESRKIGLLAQSPVHLAAAN